MTSEELNEITTALETTLSKRYDDALVDLGNMQERYHDAQDDAIFLGRCVKKLTTRNKTLTKQLADAKRDLSYLGKSIDRLLDIVASARKISPAVSARIDEIKDEVSRSYNKTNK